MVKRRKAWFILLGIFVLAGGLFAATYLPKKIITIEPKEVASIVIFDGNRGNALIITDQEQIDHIISDLNAIVFHKGEMSLFRLGYAFRVAIYQTSGGEYKEFIINSSKMIRENGFVYKAVSEEIDYAYLDGLFEKTE